MSRKRRVKAESEAEASSDDDKPILKKPQLKSQVKKSNKEGASGSGTPKPKKRATKVKEEDGGNGTLVKAKGKKKKENKEDEQEEIFRWWDAEGNGDGTVKWQTLEHNGVIFPPPYEPLPSHVKMKYNGINHNFFFANAVLSSDLFTGSGKEVDLPLAAEEVAGFYAAMLETEHAQDATFNKNFFEDWKLVMKQHPPVRLFQSAPETNACLTSDIDLAQRHCYYEFRVM